MHPASTRENLSETVTAPSTSAIGGRLLQGAAPVYQVPLPLGHDPLQNELERVCRETDRIVNLLEKEVSLLYLLMNVTLQSTFLDSCLRNCFNGELL